MGEADRRFDLAGALIETACVWCGPVAMPIAALRVHVKPGSDGLGEFVCPSCGGVNVRWVDQQDAHALLIAGARRGRGPAPFELLEERSGPPITSDDVIDFHEAVSRWGTDGTMPGHEPEQKRDAA